MGRSMMIKRHVRPMETEEVSSGASFPPNPAGWDGRAKTVKTRAASDITPIE